MTKHEASASPTRRTGADLRAVLVAATIWLERHADQVNALNVFPVPDGDTGTNMSLTMRAAIADLADDATVAESAGDVAARVEYCALMGARGNSGVILSQLLRGFSRALQGRVDYDGQVLAEALSAAAEMAYRAVIKPVEGTILTVARAAAVAAKEAAEEHNDTTYVIERALAAARIALDRTPEQLEILRQAGVVDAGGYGLVLILEGIHRAQLGEPVDVARSARVGGAAVAAVTEHRHEDGFGYCTNFVLIGQNMPFEAIRDWLAEAGESVVAVGDERLIKVHIHTPDPGAVLSFAVRHGSLGQIKIDDMNDQVIRFAATTTSASAPPAEIGLVAVSAGDGLAAIFTSLGVDRVVTGGQTMNPSTAEILTAIDATNATSVIVLPNNPNVALCANQAAELSPKRVRVVPTRSIPQGLTACLAFDVNASLEENARRMTASLACVRTGEITRAVRGAFIEGIQVAHGDTIGLLDDQLVVASADADEALLRLLTAMGASEAELITLYAGKDIVPAARGRAEALLRQHFPGPVAEILVGGQPHYDYLITVE